MAAPVVYWVDDRDRLVRVNDGWDAFARENDAPELTLDRVIDQPLWAFIGDEATRHLYAQLLLRVRRGVTARFSLRCDSPTARRRLQMVVSPADLGAVRFESVVTASEPRPDQRLLRRDLPRGPGLLTVCSWCKRVSLPEGWAEVEDAVARLAVFDVDRPPALTHGICPPCAQQMRAAFAETLAIDARRPPAKEG
jgi:hypothetical protein